MFEANAYDGPIGAQRQLFSPLHDYNCGLGEEVLQAERVEIACTIYTVEIHVIDARLPPVFVDQSERRAGDFFFSGRF